VTSVAFDSAAAFDAAATGYDVAFTDTALGRLLRGEVWKQLDVAFRPGDRVLELGCGTGEDAIHLASRGVAVVATDASDAMLTVARRKVEAAGADDLVTLARLDLRGRDLDARLAELAGGQPFDGAFSDFGALNGMADRRPLARGLADVIRVDGRTVIVVMGPFCPWEVAWHVAHGEPRSAVRRWRRGGVARVGDGQRMRVWYPSPRTLRGEFAPWFDALGARGLGVVLPPTGLCGIVEARPRLRGTLATAEDLARRLPFAAWLADHHLTVFERRAA